MTYLKWGKKWYNVIKEVIVMDFGSISVDNIQSLQQAIQISLQQKSMHKDAVSMDTLLNGMEKANAKAMESSVTPYKGRNIDARV
jgi:ABC-type polysaccharide/polyol phosphate transport system ATPase subunit